MTRRELALSFAAAVPAMAQQTAPAAPTPEEVLQAARQQVGRTRDQLRKFKVPIATEPSFVFQP